MSYRQIQDVSELSLNGLSFWDGSPIQKFYFSLEPTLAVGLGNNWSVGFIFMMYNRIV